MKASIKVKLLVIILGLYTVSLGAILFFTNRFLTGISDTRQNELYSEKISLILNELNRRDDRLRNTGLVEAYSDTFRKSALEYIKENYYIGKNMDVYPFVINEQKNLLLFPYRIETNERNALNRIISRIADNTEGNFTAAFNSGERWFIYREFKPWGWTICYSVPLHVKNQEIYSFQRLFFTISVSVSVIMFSLLFFILTRFIQPVTKLTEIAKAIADGNLEKKIDTEKDDEIGILSSSFDRMRKSVKNKIEDLNNVIEEKKEIEQSLNQAKNYLNNLMDSISSDIIAVDRSVQIVTLNDKAVKTCPGDVKSLLGEPVNKAFPLLNEYIDTIEKSIDTGETGNFNKEFRKNGHISESFDIAVYPLSGEDNEGAVIRIDDVTDKKQTEEKYLQSRKMDAIGQLAGGIAHDFNNMLGGIMGAAEQLQEELDSNEEINSELVQIILEASEKASGLTAKLLAFGKKDSFHSEPVNLHRILDNSIGLIERTIDKKIEIIVEKEADEPFFKGDSATIQNVVINMAINSANAMEKKRGTLTFRTANLEIDKDYCRDSSFNIKPGKYIKLEVKDTGSGIPPEIIDKIFDPFFTTKNSDKGTGLGLSSVYGAVQNHKGEISVISEEGKGTSFHIILPCLPGGSIEKQEIKSDWKGSGTVLVVDDEKILRKTLKAVLEKMGYNVITAEDGSQALEIFRKHSSEILFTITDLVMPNINGEELFRKIRSIKPDSAVFITSGYLEDSQLEKMKKIGVNGIIRKPFTKEKLIEMIKKAI